MYKLIQTFADAFHEVRTVDELHQQTASLIQRHLNADFGVVAWNEEAEVHALATAPSDWTDVDELLSPVSLPALASTQGESCIIDDKSDVRSAACTEYSPDKKKVRYPSLVCVPYLDNGFLLAGSTGKTAFHQTDLEILRTVGTIASLLEPPLQDATRQRDQDNFANEATTFLSHDAKNLLSVINGRLQLVQDSPDDEQFENIEDNLQRLEELIEDTETLLHTGDHVTDVEPVSLREAANLAWGSIETVQAHLFVSSTDQILAEESRLYQLLENLFRNALDHTGPEVTVKVGPLDDAEGFYVEDDGPGIEPDVRESLFELGYSSSEDNTGIGLTIVQRIADAHDWEISITSSVVGGARFEFTGVEFATDEPSEGV